MFLFDDLKKERNFNILKNLKTKTTKTNRKAFTITLNEKLLIYLKCKFNLTGRYQIATKLFETNFFVLSKQTTAFDKAVVGNIECKVGNPKKLILFDKTIIKSLPTIAIRFFNLIRKIDE
jgi:hypothetical protein